MAKKKTSDRIYEYLSGFFGSGVIVLLGAAVAILAFAAYPSIFINGLTFFTKTLWDARVSGKIVTVSGIQTMAGSSFGILVFIVDTLVSSAIAVALAIPAGLGSAVLLTQIAPRRVAAPLSLMIEMMAGIPSVIYGLWGLVVLGPYLLNTVEPYLAQHLSFIPFFASSGPPKSYGLFAAGIILAIMIIPIITSISRDMMARTPKELWEGARALGLTRWEVTRRVVLPFAKTAIVGSVVLGLGRALGETMAIAMLLGAGTRQLPVNLYSPVSTISAFMLLELPNAYADPSGMDLSALMELGLILLALTIAANILARLLIKQGFTTSSENLVRV